MPCTHAIYCQCSLDFVVHVHQDWTDTSTEFPPTQCMLLTWYSPKGPINRPRMNQDVMLCGSLLHQILPDVNTTLYLNAVRKGERKTKCGKGRDRQHIYSIKKTENLRLWKFPRPARLSFWFADRANCWEVNKVKCWKWAILSRKQRRKMSRYYTGAEFLYFLRKECMSYYSSVSTLE
jgi:hypothetical protein